MKYFICLFCFLMSILSFNLITNNSSLPKQDQISDRTIIRFSKEMKAKRNLLIWGIGGGADNGVWLLTVSFGMYHAPLTKDEARKLIVGCVEDFLTTINQDEELKPYLKTYPFTSKNVELNIFLYGPDKSRILSPYIADISSTEGIIYYGINDPNNQYKYLSRTSETYEEALAILKKQEEMNK